MKCLIRHGGIGLLLFFCWLSAASAQPGLGLGQLRVADIIVTNIGPEVASPELVRANIHIKKGDVYDQVLESSIHVDERNLYATGFFSDVRTARAFTDKGVVLTYVLQGKYRLTGISFSGNTKLSNAKLLKKVTLKIGSPVDEATLFDNAREMEKLYESKSYSGTKVKYEIVNIDQTAGRAGVTFEVTETIKLKIVDVKFTGATAFTQAKLRKVIKTRRHWMFSWLTRSGIFKEDVFDDDKDKLREFYQKAGYIDFEIRDIKITRPTPKTMNIDFVIYEGKVYKVGSVTFTGNKLFTTEQIIQGLKRQHDATHSKIAIGEHGLEADVGMTYTPQAIEHDVQAVQDFYGTKGYIGNRPTPGIPVNLRRIPNIETGTMDLEYQLDEGQQSFIEKILIKGNIKTKDRVIRRELSVSPGDVFDMVQVRLSKQRVEGLDYFEKVDTKPEPTEDLPNHKDLIIGVDEKSTGNLTFGAGFNTVESVSGYVQLEQRNFDLFNPPYFTGGGQKFLMRVQIGTLLQEEKISFVEPWFLNRKLILGIDLYHSVFNYQSQNTLYDEERTGALFSLTRALGSDRLRGTVSYNLEDVDIINVNTNAPNAILQDAGSALLSRFGASLAYDTRGFGDLPNKGQRTELSTSLTVGDHDYLGLGLHSAWYFKGFGQGHVLEILGKADVLQNLSSGDVPFYDRLYLGGQDTLRGFDYRGVGPRSVSQDGSFYEPIGGDTRWMGSAEYSIPIITDNLRFALFYDIGNVSARAFSNAPFPVIGKSPDQAGGTTIPTPGPGTQTYPGNTGSFSDNWGVGLHLNIPHLGPLRLDLGIPIHHDPFNGPGAKFQFGVGFNRPL